MIIYKTTGRPYDPTDTAPASWSRIAATGPSAGNGTQNAGSGFSLWNSNMTAYNVSSATLLVNRILATPIVVGRTRTLRKLGLVITTAGSVDGTANIGIYTNISASPFSFPLPDSFPSPENLIASTGSYSTSGVTGAWLRPLLAEVTLEANQIYWVGHIIGGTTSPSFVTCGTNRAFSQSTLTVYGAGLRSGVEATLTNSFPVGPTTTNTTVPMVIMEWAS